MTTRLVRIVVALVWIEEGLWAKLLRRSAEEVAIVQTVGARVGLSATVMLVVIGLGEIAIAGLVLADVRRRPMAWLQIALVITMNAAGIVCGGASDPVDLVVHNLPFLMCLFVLTRPEIGRGGRA